VAMRDPGRPGRNPFFDLGAYGRDELGRDQPPFGDHDPLSPPDHVPGGTGGPAGAGRPGASLFDGLFVALAEASPEAAEHLVTAAHEMVLAVKVIVDAAESALAEHRRAFGDAAAAGDGPVLRPVDGG